eukprot:CAMPEP_0168466230 /NCGR_PEP_ID=MMETSP0228-20121227/56545_1 /TAXON_ID=133427 /ORGANISM="Protoceratium reticulatum, Strain CCCM 535 (=CCMP 1889)" /LENGTH=68 /DNA_ID=CAMNT_0008481873 /DNA_START=8 /DNA_END=214 /DNA_ORIENTATION=-
MDYSVFSFSQASGVAPLSPCADMRRPTAATATDPSVMLLSRLPAKAAAVLEDWSVSPAHAVGTTASVP